MEKIILSKKNLKDLKANYELPLFVYLEDEIEYFAKQFLNFESAYWLDVRFAMKSNPNKSILKKFDELWIKIDASSIYECERAINAWILPQNILLTSQEIPQNFELVKNLWIEYNCTSLYQLKEFWKKFPWSHISLRINPWIWSWSTNRTNVWWVSSSFWIWFEYINKIKNIINEFDLIVKRIHTHIWSWTDPDVWIKVANMSIELLKYFETATILNLWWWFKIWRMDYEKSADLKMISKEIKIIFENFFKKTWRKIFLEIEPWTYLIANCWYLLCEIQDIVDTWVNWYNFLKLNTWMTEITRPSMYWAQHPIYVINDSNEKQDYIVVWHCCESWDILSPKENDPEWLKTRNLNKANIWDLVLIWWAWAYCSSMSTKNYNSYPECWEIFVKKNWEFLEIRKRQTLEQIIQNEI